MQNNAVVQSPQAKPNKLHVNATSGYTQPTNTLNTISSFPSQTNTNMQSNAINNQTSLPKSEPTLSWSAQCLTPIFENLQKSKTVGASINSPSIITTSVAANTTTTTTVTKPIMSANINAVVTNIDPHSTKSSSNSPQTSLKALQTSSTPASRHTNVNNDTRETSIKINATTADTHTYSSQQSAKRSRNSPQTNKENQNTKKQKQQPHKQNTLTKYWLSNNNENMFAALAIESDKHENTVNAEVNPEKKKSSSKPPPIYVQRVEQLSVLTNALNKIENCKYDIRTFKNNEVKIQAYESTHYTSIIKLLKEKSTEFFTYKAKSDRGFKVFLRGMHYSTDPDEIIQELRQLGHEVLNIQNILSRTKKALNLFSIELKQRENNKEIYNIKNLLHCIVSVEPPKPQKSIPQCMNCQKYGHTKNFCTKSPVCVKCAGNHKTINCTTKGNENIKCALCGDSHTANYKGCAVYKALKVKKFPELREKVIPNVPKPPPQGTPTSDATFQQAQPSPKNSQTYASVLASGHSPNPIETTETSNNDLSELKEMMKTLIMQITGMMTLLTSLVSKINATTN